MVKRIERAAMIFSGSFPSPDFVEFATQRAARLDLGFTLRSADAICCAVEIAGQPDLLDAFEMACLLGPLDCRVDRCERTRIGWISGGAA